MSDYPKVTSIVAMFPYPKGTHVQVGAYLLSVSGKGQNSEAEGREFLDN